jgi:hypothetical protein
MSRLTERFETVFELLRMVRDRRLFLMLPLVLALILLLLFVTMAEMPVLIPFFYAVF